MAKRRKKSHRRRRISGIAMSANSPVVKFGSLGLGFVISDTVWQKVDEQMTTPLTEDQKKLINGIAAAGGLYFLFMAKGKKSTALTALAGVLTGIAAKGLAKDFGVISGFRDLPVIGGYQQVPAIGNGYMPASGMINGVGGYSVPKPSVMGSVPGADAGSGINSTDR